MNTIQVFENLRAALVKKGKAIAAVGIDLGTTKSCAAIARFDPESGQIQCACVPYSEPGVAGEPIAVPSVVALKGDVVLVGHAARRCMGKKQFTPQRNLFRETKNEIGLRYTYWKAPEGYKSATAIAALLLNHLIDGVGSTDCEIELPFVITVPASFHGAQRAATLDAASAHVGDASDVRLLDEPYAAFLDLLFRQPDDAKAVLRDGANILVFDFGGGTCDVAIFTLTTSAKGALEPRLRATSRYHRIGGGDLDRAIVHDHLIPQLLERHGLTRTSFSWKQKRYVLEPQLLPLAERLKIALCKRITELREAGQPETDAVEAVAAGEYEIVVDEKSFWLESPRLTPGIFRRILLPFIDAEPPPETSDDYVERGSIFSPITHALFHAGLDTDDIHGIILAGSSSLIPQVQDVLRKRFAEATLIRCLDGAELQGAIARGAALQALALAATAEPLVAPVCSAPVGVQTRQGIVNLTLAGTRLPAASVQPIRLLAPEDSRERPVEIAVEVHGDGQRTVGRSMWTLPAPVRKGEALDLTWTLDMNQCLELDLHRPGHENTEPFHHRFDAPVTHIDQSQIVRCRMLEREQAIRDDRVPKDEMGKAFENIARDASTLGENERALHFVALALMHQGSTLNLLNLRGIYRERLGDREGAEQSYRQASTWDTSLFNLALLQTKSDRHVEALETINQAIELSANRESSVLKGQITDKLGRAQDARLLYADAIAGVIDLKSFDDFQLSWLLKAARVLERADLVKTIDAEQRERGVRMKKVLRQGVLPDCGVEPSKAGV